MSDAPRSSRSRAGLAHSHASSSRGPDDLLDDLARPGPGPDLTRAIMGRLGFMKVTDRVTRRRRLRRSVGRTMITAVMFSLVIAGFFVHQNGRSARGPSGLTVPSAIRRDVDRHQRRLDWTIRTIRSIAPRLDQLRLEPDPYQLEREQATAGPIC